MTQPSRGGNLLVGVGVALAAAIATGLVWVLVGNAADGRQIGWAAIAVGAAIGFAAGRFGGPDPVLAVVSGALGAAAVFVGDLFIVAHAGAEALGTSSFTVLTDYWEQVWSIYTEDFVDPISLLFYGLSAAAAFRLTQSVGRARFGDPAPAWDPPTGPPAPPAEPSADFSAGAWQQPTAEPPSPEQKPGD